MYKVHSLCQDVVEDANQVYMKHKVLQTSAQKFFFFKKKTFYNKEELQTCNCKNVHTHHQKKNERIHECDLQGSRGPVIRNDGRREKVPSTRGRSSSSRDTASREATTGTFHRWGTRPFRRTHGTLQDWEQLSCGQTRQRNWERSPPALPLSHCLRQHRRYFLGLSPRDPASCPSQSGLFLWFCQGLSLSRRWISPDLSATFLEKPRYPHLFIELSRPASRKKVFCIQKKHEMGGPCPVPIVGIRRNVLDNFQSFEILQHLTSTNCFSSNWWHVQIVQETLESVNALINFVFEHRWNVWKLRTAVHAVKSNDYCD